MGNDNSRTQCVRTLFAAIDDMSMTPAERAQALADLARPRDEGAQAPRLAPDKHPTRDFFIADILDAAPKDDLASMEHPIFALRAGDTRVRTYERNGVAITISPTASGCATIHDKDLWIYCVSQLVEAKNRGRDISRTVSFTMHDFLVTTNRDTSGRDYARAASMLERLAGTRITTNIETDNVRERQGFGLIDSYRVVERDDQRMIAVEVDLPRWLYRAIDANQVLTLDRAYFRLRKPLDRRVYELARKHCGKQKEWTCSVSTLHEKSGSAGTLRRFRLNVRQLAASDALPEYKLMYDAKRDTLTFHRRNVDNH